jgi:hypothetical protein
MNNNYYRIKQVYFRPTSVLLYMTNDYYFSAN